MYDDIVGFADIVKFYHFAFDDNDIEKVVISLTTMINI